MEDARILVPIDFSDCTPRITHDTAEIARRMKADMTLLHVVDGPLDLGVRFTPEGSTDPVTAGEYLVRAALSRMPHIAAAVADVGVEVDHRVLQGPVVDTILNEAEQGGYSMIAMGTHGRRGPARWMLGSIAERVLRLATCPVLTIRTIHRPECQSGSCAFCEAHLTPEYRQVVSEAEG